MCQIEDLAELFLDGRAGAPLWPRGQGASRNQMWRLMMRYKKQNIPSRENTAQVDTGSVCTDLMDADCTTGREGAGGSMELCKHQQHELCSVSGFELHQPCTQHGFTKLCKDPTANTCKREIPLSSSGGTKIAEIVKTDVPELPRLQPVMSILAFESWKGNVGEVNKVNAHGSQTKAGIGNGSHHGHRH